MKNASQLDFTALTEHIKPSEFPAGVLEHMDPSVIVSLAYLRERTGAPFFPSPVPRAHVRHEPSGSRHSTQDKTRLSDATDFFVQWKYAGRVLVAATGEADIGGIGVYNRMRFTGRSGEYAMFHIDNRPERVVWAAVGRNPVRYVYAHSSPAAYYAEVADMLENWGR